MMDCHYPSSYLSYTFTDAAFPGRAIKPLSLSHCASYIDLQGVLKSKEQKFRFEMGVLHHLCSGSTEVR